MAEVIIKDEQLAALKDQVVVLTGGSSGIGLATTELLLSLGAHVVSGDIQSSPLTHANLTSVHTDVSSWKDLVALFAAATAKHPRVHHVFANAGLPPQADYLAFPTDPSTGELQEPTSKALDIMLKGVINTTYLGLHHFTQLGQRAGGSVVITTSASAFQRFQAVDYATAKHGALGFMRGLVARLQTATEKLPPVRVNALAPGWTATGILAPPLRTVLGDKVQGADTVARNVALLFADETRQGELHFSDRGRVFEIDNAVLLPAGTKIFGLAEPLGVSLDADVKNSLEEAKAAQLKEERKELSGALDEAFRRETGGGAEA